MCSPSHSGWLFLCLATTVVHCSKPWAIESLPNPKTDPKGCGQTSASSVCDIDGLLHDSTGLDAALRALTSDYEYPGCGGYEMAVVVVRRISGGTESATERFAKAAMDAWGVGKAACNNGIVLAIAVEDRHMHIATGRGAAEYLPNRELQAIIERMKPLMREQRYGTAAEQCVSDIARILSGETLSESNLAGNAIVMIFAVLVVGVVTRSCTQNRKYGRCKRALTQIEQERAEARANRYQAVSCSICLENFADTPRKETALLHCGHTFHRCCVDSWKESRCTCPICRQPADPDAAESRISSSARLQRPAFATSGYNYDDEYMFRIHRARALYPDFVSQPMANRWTAPGYCGPVVADTAFIRSSPSYQSSSGGSARASSFGGGCSSGGGGRGGSW